MVIPGVMIRKPRPKRLLDGERTALTVCHAISMAMTVVFPLPVERRVARKGLSTDLCRANGLDNVEPHRPRGIIIRLSNEVAAQPGQQTVGCQPSRAGTWLVARLVLHLQHAAGLDGLGDGRDDPLRRSNGCACRSSIPWPRAT
jgi:hypothetical protein